LCIQAELATDTYNPVPQVGVLRDATLRGQYDVASGRDCLDGPYVDHASCLIIDIIMPDIDGIESHALIAASGRDIPTKFISGITNQKIINRAQSVGGAAILNKPCDANSLHDAIVKAIAA
jgi:FixJ family two-component response regulator